MKKAFRKIAKAISITTTILLSTVFLAFSAFAEGGGIGDNHIDWEENAPAQTEGWNACHGTPHSDVWSQEGSYRLDKLTEGQCGCQVLT